MGISGQTYQGGKVEFELKSINKKSLVSSSCKAKMQAISPRENVHEISSAKSL